MSRRLACAAHAACGLGFVAALFAVSGPAAAAVLADLYSGAVEITGAPPAEAELVRAAFDALLVKLTDPATRVAARLAPPGDTELRAMVSSVSYLEGAGEAGAPAAGARVVTRFEPAAVDAWLMRRGLPRWQPERQRWRLWLVLDAAGERRLVRAADSEIHAAVRRAAADFGLPVEMPGDDDLPDPGSVAAERLIAAIRGGYPEDPVFASLPAAASGAGRMDSAAPLLATARPMQGGWQVRWRALADGELIALASGDAELAAALVAGIGRFAGEIARRNLLRNTALQTLAVEISGLAGPRTVGEALSRLAGLSQIESLAIVAARGDRLALELRARAGPDWLRSALRLETDWLERHRFETAGNGADRPPPADGRLQYRVDTP